MQSDRKNSTWLAFQYIITLVFSLITLKLNINHFGQEAFGIWIALASIWGFSTSLDFGFGIAIVKYVAQYKNEEKTINKILSSIFFIFILLGVIIFAIGNVIAILLYFISSSIIPVEQIETFKYVFFVLGISFLFQYLSIFFKSIIEGLSNFFITSIILIIQNFLILVGVVAISVLELEIRFLAYLYLSVALVTLSFYLFYFTYKIKNFRITIKNFEIKETKRIFGFSFSIQMMNSFNALIDPIVKYMIGNYYNINVVPAYEIARRFAVAISGLFFNTFKIILPKASALRSKDEILLFIKDDVVKYCKIGIIYSGVTFGIFLLPVAYIILFIFGIKEAIIIFIILALPESINNFGYSIYNFLLGVGKAKFLAFLQFVNLLLVVISLFIGFNVFESSLGLLGYFVSVIIGNLLMILYLKKKWDIPILNFVSAVKIYKLFILIGLLSIVMFSLFYDLATNWLLLAVLTMISTAIFINDVKYIFHLLFQDVKSKLSLH